MKRFLSILLSVLMVVSVLAILASCNGNEQNTTTAEDKTEATTTTTAKTDTTTEQTTTQAAVTTTEAAVTTTEAVVTTTEAVVTTTEAVVTTTEAVVTTTEETTTTAEVTTTAKPVETTTLPVFARLDFGTKTYAEDQGLTSHDYLMEALSYDDTVLQVTFEEDYWDVWTLAAYDGSSAMTEAFGQKNIRYALIFNDLVTFDFDDEIVLGYGGYKNTPYKNVEDIATPTWQGYHQYMQIRLVNNTTNNIWGFRFIKTGDGAYYTTCVVGNLYLQGGEPTSSTDLRRTCTASTEWATYTYDILLTSGLASGRGHHACRTKGATLNLNNWFDYKNYVFEKGDPGGTNVTWNLGKSFTALEFNIFGGVYTYGYAASEYGDDVTEEASKAYSDALVQACDTRANIKAGMNVKIDYIIFGSSPEQLDAWKSYMEQNA